MVLLCLTEATAAGFDTASGLGSDINVCVCEISRPSMLLELVMIPAQVTCKEQFDFCLLHGQS